MTRVFAVAAHPDDIEFGFAGTLILLARAGCEIHYMNIADGSCGSIQHDAETIARIRLQEAQNSAQRLGAVFHPPLTPDLEVFYEKAILRKLASIMRDVAPDILLVPSPQDYMEDHMNACRLAVTAAFTLGVKNFQVDPPRASVLNQVAVYHAQPHGNREMLNRIIYPDFVVNIETVMAEKTAMLAEHKSQKDWLEKTQGMDAYLKTMETHNQEIGALSKQCKFAEGWRRHNPLGFCQENFNPMADLLPKYLRDCPKNQH